MKTCGVLVVILLSAASVGYLGTQAQKPSLPTSDEEGINALYREWSQATVTRGGEGYASYFVADGAVLPPNERAAEGKQAIRDLIQKSLDAFTLKDPHLNFGDLRVKDGWATRRFTITVSAFLKLGARPSSSTISIWTCFRSSPTERGGLSIECTTAISTEPDFDPRSLKNISD